MKIDLQASSKIAREIKENSKTHKLLDGAVISVGIIEAIKRLSNG